MLYYNSIHYDEFHPSFDIIDIFHVHHNICNIPNSHIMDQVWDSRPRKAAWSGKPPELTPFKARKQLKSILTFPFTRSDHFEHLIFCHRPDLKEEVRLSVMWAITKSHTIFMDWSQLWWKSYCIKKKIVIGMEIKRPTPHQGYQHQEGNTYLW